jgi:hypothetical protein
VGLERGPLSLMSTTEELLNKKSSGSCLENREYGLGIRHADHVTTSIRKKWAITSPTSGVRSVGIVRSRTEAMEFSSVWFNIRRNLDLNVNLAQVPRLLLTLRA